MPFTVIFHAMWTTVMREHFAIGADRSPYRGQANQPESCSQMSLELRLCIGMAQLLTVLYHSATLGGYALSFMPEPFPHDVLCGAFCTGRVYLLIIGRSGSFIHNPNRPLG